MGQKVFFAEHGPEELRYVVIVSRYNGKWVYVRHRERETYEIPGGHTEPGESEYEAASRELEEETGAADYTLYRICYYGVVWEGQETLDGALFYAQISAFDELPDFEIAERILCKEPPDNQTYPAIQPFLLDRAKEWLRHQDIHG